MAVSPPPAISPYDLNVLGAGFPPGLNTAFPPDTLGVDETPDGYGFDLSKDGVLAKASMPSGSARTLKSITIVENAANIPYFWAYNRLWNITNRTASTGSNILTVGARYYEDIYVPQGFGKFYFDETTNNILAIQPFGADSMFIATAGGGYVLSGISDTRMFWSRSDLIEEIKCGSANGLVELDGVVYVAGTTALGGLRAYDRGEVVDLTRKVRDDLTTNFGNMALTVDYEKKYIVGGTSYIYEVPTKKLFRWSSTNFRYTSRQFHRRNWEPFSVDGLLFTVKHTDTDKGTFKWQVKVEDRAWSQVDTAVVQYEEDNFTMFKLSMDSPNNSACRKFQLRLTDLSTNLQIKEIRVDSAEFQQDDYSQ